MRGEKNTCEQRRTAPNSAKTLDYFASFSLLHYSLFFIIAVHRAFVLGLALGARHRGIIAELSEDRCYKVCVTVFAFFTYLLTLRAIRSVHDGEKTQRSLEA